MSKDSWDRPGTVHSTVGCGLATYFKFFTSIDSRGALVVFGVLEGDV